MGSRLELNRDLSAAIYEYAHVPTPTLLEGFQPTGFEVVDVVTELRPHQLEQAAKGCHPLRPVDPDLPLHRSRQHGAAHVGPPPEGSSSEIPRRHRRCVSSSGPSRMTSTGRLRCPSRGGSTRRVRSSVRGDDRYARCRGARREREPGRRSLIRVAHSRRGRAADAGRKSAPGQQRPHAVRHGRLAVRSSQLWAAYFALEWVNRPVAAERRAQVRLAARRHRTRPQLSHPCCDRLQQASASSARIAQRLMRMNPGAPPSAGRRAPGPGLALSSRCPPQRDRVWSLPAAKIKKQTYP
jgi:hypothetical protein